MEAERRDRAVREQSIVIFEDDANVDFELFERKFGTLLNSVPDDYDIISLDANPEYCRESVMACPVVMVAPRESSSPDERRRRSEIVQGVHDVFANDRHRRELERRYADITSFAIEPRDRHVPRAPAAPERAQNLRQLRRNRAATRVGDKKHHKRKEDAPVVLANSSIARASD